MKIQLTREQASLLNIATVISTKDGVIYKYIPFFFKVTDSEDIFECFNFHEELPEELELAIKEFYSDAEITSKLPDVVLKAFPSPSNKSSKKTNNGKK